jgi:amidase
MKLAEYASYDAIGLADLVARKQVSSKELARTAAKAVEAVNGELNAVVELYPDRIDGLDDGLLGNGPFRGVPFLFKDVFGHEKGRRIEFGSRLCKGMVGETDSAVAVLARAAGLNALGRSAAPEYSMSGTTEGALYGNTSNPWKRGYSAGGSSGGAQAAVTAGMVPVAHGSDIGGSIRVPASWCGGVGLKPSRGRVPIGPTIDEGGFGMSMNFLQAKSVRDAAALLDCFAVPQPGDPFLIPKPEESYAALARKPARKLRIGLLTSPLAGVQTDPEVKAAVEAAGRKLTGLGHSVEPAEADFGGLVAMRKLLDFWFFNFHVRLDGYGARTGRKPGPDTLEPVILKLYEYAKSVTGPIFMQRLLDLNQMRRKLGEFYVRHDIWLSPTTARVSEPHGHYNLGRGDIGIEDIVERLYAVPCQFCLPHNIMGTPAISLPLAMHSSGLPIGVQIAGRPADEHTVLQLASALEEAMPWASRTPTIHVSRA